MNEYLPILLIGGAIGLITLIFVLAYAFMKDKKTAIGFDRNMKDGEIIRRMVKYVKPYTLNFLIAIIIMLLSVAYDIISPLIIKEITKMISGDFEMRALLNMVLIYASMLVVSLICTYIQAIILQVTGQKILSNIREDVFSHIESLSHNQLNHQPVGKLVTRVTNDTNAISMTFTGILVNLIKNVFVILRRA